jgi:hypothetical protein
MVVQQELKYPTEPIHGIQQMMKKHISKEKEPSRELLLHLKLLHLAVY